MRLKLGKELGKRRLSPYIYETEEEAQRAEQQNRGGGKRSAFF